MRKWCPPMEQALVRILEFWENFKNREIFKSWHFGQNAIQNYDKMEDTDHILS
jgi:hypothetical protein